MLKLEDYASLKMESETMETIGERWYGAFLVIEVVITVGVMMVTSLLPFSIGGQVYLELARFSSAEMVTYLLVGLCVVLLLYYALDVQYWGNCWVKWVWKIAIFAMAVGLMLMETKSYSVVPLMLSVMVLVSFIYAFKKFTTLDQTSTFVYVQMVSRCSFLVGVLLMLTWVGWILSSSQPEEGCGKDHTWNVHTREFAYFQIRCNFQVEIINNGTTMYLPCTFDGGCDNYLNESFPANEFNIRSETILSGNKCQLRPLNMLIELAERYIAYHQQAANELKWEQQSDDKLIIVSQVGKEFHASFRVRYHGCLRAFMLWSAPFCFGLCLLWVFFILRSIALDADHLSMKNRRASTFSTEVSKTKSKVFSRIMVFLLVAVWSGASIGGADMDLSNVVMLFAVGGMIGGVMGYAFVFGWNSLFEFVSQSSVFQRITNLSGSDWAKALVLLLMAPVIGIAVVLSFINQTSRRYLGCLAKPLKDEREKRLWLTVKFSNRLQPALTWQWTSILSKVILLALLYMILNVVISKFTAVLLSAFNDWIREQGFSVMEVTAIFFAYGMFIFLNPLIPGVPVYISGGIVLVEASRVEMGFWTAIAFTIVICTMLKFSAIAVQQKVFGEGLGKFITVRRFVSVNSVTTKSIKLILEQPGMTFDKVLVLCGGPDWPVSCLTGILKQSLVRMIFGSLPIILLIAPCVVSGALLLRENESAIWSSASIVALGIAVMSQTVAMVAAMNSISRVAKEKREEIEAMPIDQEVFEFEKLNAEKLAAMKAMKDWHRNGFPMAIKAVYCFGAVVMTTVFHMAVLFGGSCFRSFSVSDSIAVDLDGSAWNLIKYPLGYVAVVLVMVGLACIALTEFYFAYCCSYNQTVVPISNDDIDKQVAPTTKNDE